MDSIQDMISRRTQGATAAKKAAQEKAQEEEDDPDLLDFDEDPPGYQERIYFEDDFTEDEFNPGEMDEDAYEMDVELDGDAEMFNLTSTTRDRRRSSTQSGKSLLPNGKRKRNPGHNEAISKGLKEKYWADVKAGKIPAPNNSNRRRRKPAESIPPVVQEAPTQTWGAAPACIPNSTTGAWDTPSQPEPPRPVSRKGKYWPRVQQLPEPTTYLQASDGSWSVRPVGHGVKPIMVRPNARVNGEINEQWQKIITEGHKGHRPVYIPDKEKVSSIDLNGTRKRQSKKRKAQIASSEASDRASMPPPPKKQKLDGNPGLDTLPPAFGLPASMYKGPEISDKQYFRKYPKIVLADQYLWGDATKATHQSWTVDRAFVAAGEVCELQWDDKCAFTMQTLPYDELDEEERVEFAPIPTVVEPKKKGRKPRASKKVDTVPVHDFFTVRPTSGPGSRGGGRGRGGPGRGRGGRGGAKRARPKTVVPKWEPTSGPSRKERGTFTRRQLALTTDFEKLGKDPWEMSQKLNVDVVLPNEISTKRSRHGNTTMSRVTENKFIIAVVVSRTLCGGKARYIDWVLMSSIFQKYSPSFLMNYWRKISAGRDAIMDALTKDFQKEYPIAYQEGRVPKFNFDKLVDNDWKTLLSWVSKNVVKEYFTADIEVPDTREEFDEEHEMHEMDIVDKWRDVYYHKDAAKMKRVEAVSNVPRHFPVTHSTWNVPDEATAEEQRKARSYLRATAFTSAEDWDAAPEHIRVAKVKSLDPEIAQQALDRLTKIKVLMRRNKGRDFPGRGWEGTDAFFATLRKHHMKEFQFIEAIAFKEQLDADFRSGKEVMLDYFGNEGSFMVLSSLQAAGRIRIQNLNVPMQKFGLMDEGYETKTIPKERMQFEMLITPTSTYLYDSDNEQLQFLFNATAPHDNVHSTIAGGGEKIPMWYNIFGQLLPDLWKKVLVAVSQVMALRAGVNLRELTKTFKPTLEDWELKLFVEWGVEVGIFEQIMPGIEGWVVSEHWWAILGRLLAYASDVEGDVRMGGV